MRPCAINAHVAPGDYVAERLTGGRGGIQRVIHVDSSPAMIEYAKVRWHTQPNSTYHMRRHALRYPLRACRHCFQCICPLQVPTLHIPLFPSPISTIPQAFCTAHVPFGSNFHTHKTPNPVMGVQARRARLQAADPSKSWPEVHYVIADEEQLPLAPGSVDGECCRVRHAKVST